MWRRQDSIARPDLDVGEARTTITSSHVDNSLAPTSSRSFHGFPSSSPNPYHQPRSFEANTTLGIDFSAVRHRGGSTYEQPSVTPNPPQSDSTTRAYHEGYVNGYYQAILSGAAAAQVSPPFVSAVSAIVPGPSGGSGLQSPALPLFATSANSSPPRQTLSNTSADLAINSQAPGWGSEHLFQNFGRSRNSPTLRTSQLDASSAAPQAPVSLPSPAHSVIIMSQSIPVPPLGSQGDNESHECTWPKCGKYFRRRYLLEDHVSYTHRGTKRHACPADGCGNEYVAHAGLMKHVKKKHLGLVVMPSTSVDDVD